MFGQLAEREVIELTAMLVLYAPFVAAFLHPIPFLLLVIVVPALSWAYSRYLLGKLAKGLIVSMSFVGIWAGSLGLLWLLDVGR